ncbi:hypothetical protein [Oxynema aestuarii]|uniref:Uncharacterized protein n=1 Tax=Oxynema aestuarii AP17 TaxID=2064643 RepID=A0A6H1TW28_9CYAN|nr:hypothetical protein [Oxynema aestuarii]QIZ70357.1 hypothetical protein HCG48_07005 [Oxynema aestuarii AP17]
MRTFEEKKALSPAASGRSPRSRSAKREASKLLKIPGLRGGFSPQLGNLLQNLTSFSDAIYHYTCDRL